MDTMDVDEPSTQYESLDLMEVDSNTPLFVLKLPNGAPLLNQIRHTSSSSATITFQKDSAVMAVIAGGDYHETGFRVGFEETHNLLISHENGEWKGIGQINSKLYPTDWTQTATSSKKNESQSNSTRVLSPSELKTLQKVSPDKSKKSTRPAKKTAPSERPNQVAGKGPAKSSSTAKKSTPNSRRAPLTADSDDDGDDDDDDDSDDESDSEDARLPKSRLGTQRPDTNMSTPPNNSIPSKRPRGVPIAKPVAHTAESDDDDDDGDEEEEDGETSPSPPRPTPSKRPRSSYPTPSKSVASVDKSNFHTINAVEFDMKQINALSGQRDISSYAEFANTYDIYKQLYPQYIKLHGELVKNKADFQSIQSSISKGKQLRQDITALLTEQKKLYDERHEIVEPMRVAYTRLHAVMHSLRNQMESYASQFSNHRR